VLYNRIRNATLKVSLKVKIQSIDSKSRCESLKWPLIKMLATLSSLEWEHSDEFSKSLTNLQLEGLLDTKQVVDDEREELVDL
jgi:hypothetical protein